MVARITHPFAAAALGRTVGGVIAAVLFAAILLFALLVTLRYAYGWADLFSEAAVAAPMAADGIVAIVSAALTGLAVAWLYVRQLTG